MLSTEQTNQTNIHQTAAGSTDPGVNPENIHSHCTQSQMLDGLDWGEMFLTRV